jgi:hypothetical protein
MKDKYYRYKPSEPAKTICEDCGNVYLGGRYSFYCADCRKRRLSEAAKKRNLSRIGVNARWGRGKDEN